MLQTFSDLAGEYPLVSVLITAYNREKLIVEALESVLKCTYSHIEIIVVDDNSKDNTLNVIKTFAAKDNRISYYKNENNLGDYSNRNKAVSYARGEYFTFLDSDDRMLPDGLEKCMEGMLKFPEAGIGMHWAYSNGESFLLSSKEVVEEHFFKRQVLVVGPGGTVLKRTFFDTIKGYPEKYGPANDMYFNLKAACSSDVVMFPFQFFYYREHESRESNNWYSYLVNNYMFLKDALAEITFPITEKEKHWVANKNKRRFLLTLIRYLFFTGNINKVAMARRTVNFSLKDIFDSLFHEEIKRKDLNADNVVKHLNHKVI